MNFENPNLKKEAETTDSVNEALKLVRDMNKEEKAAFFQAMGGEIKQNLPLEKREVGEGVSYGVEVSSAYEEVKNRIKEGY